MRRSFCGWWAEAEEKCETLRLAKVAVNTHPLFAMRASFSTRFTHSYEKNFCGKMGALVRLPEALALA